MSSWMDSQKGKWKFSNFINQHNSVKFYYFTYAINFSYPCPSRIFSWFSMPVIVTFHCFIISPSLSMWHAHMCVHTQTNIKPTSHVSCLISLPLLCLLRFQSSLYVLVATLWLHVTSIFLYRRSPMWSYIIYLMCCRHLLFFHAYLPQKNFNDNRLDL